MGNIKVLIINTVGVKYEGITSVIYNYASNMNRKGLDLDLCVYCDTDEQLKNRFKELGKVQVVHDRKHDVMHYIKDLNSLLRNGYDVIHIHGNSGTMFIDVALAKIHHVKKIIVHSHNTTCDHKYLNSLLKFPMKVLATDLIACSDEAGKWLYGSSDYTILNNAIELENYKYNSQLRCEYREKFGITDEFLIGHSGNFNEQKNHSFLIDIFNEYHKLDPVAKLLLLSDGPKCEEIKEKVKKLKLTENVIFAGRCGDANRMYSAMDLFLLPSLWEGLPLVLLEAQANGLPIIASDVVTKELNCTDRLFYYGLDNSAFAWAEMIQKVRSNLYLRTEDGILQLRKNGFDIKQEANKLRNIYYGTVTVGGVLFRIRILHSVYACIFRHEICYGGIMGV